MALALCVAERDLARLAFNTDRLLLSLLLNANDARIQELGTSVARRACVRVICRPAAPELTAAGLCGPASLVQLFRTTLTATLTATGNKLNAEHRASCSQAYTQRAGFKSSD
jgi:hypothetical protein